MPAAPAGPHKPYRSCTLILQDVTATWGRERHWDCDSSAGATLLNPNRQQEGVSLRERDGPIFFATVEGLQDCNLLCISALCMIFCSQINLILQLMP